MKTAIFPGSFNPWHEAHEHILKKALEVFDFVIVARGRNGAKPLADTDFQAAIDYKKYGTMHGEYRVTVMEFSGTLADFANSVHASAVVRGLRNVFDFYEEKDNQYWHEDLGLKCPIFYVISDRKLGHISSKAVRIVDAIKKESK